LVSHLEIAKEKHFECLDVGTEVFLFLVIFRWNLAECKKKNRLICSLFYKFSRINKLFNDTPYVSFYEDYAVFLF